MTFHVVIETTITAFSEAEWNHCFPGDPENWSFYRACELAGPPGFEWFYPSVRRDGHLVAVVPAFGTQYRLDTTVQGPAKRLTEFLYRLMPSLLSLRLLAMGSPVAEICHLGFAPDVNTSQKPDLLSRLVAGLRQFGRQNRFSLLGVKDAPSYTESLWAEVMAEGGFTRLPGLPTAVLDLPYDTIDGYLAGLSRATRKDMKRKMKAFSSVRVEQRNTIDDVVEEVARLYGETVAHSELQFEYLPADYFPQLLRLLAPQASIFLYWAEERLIAFNFVIETEGRLIDKYIGMNYAVVPRYSLYFNSWLHNVRYCLERGIPRYQSGQAFYGPKLRLGCRLLPNWQYFRHSNAAINAMLQLVAHLVRLDRFDPAIADLVGEMP